MTRAMFVLVCLVLLTAFAPVACAPDNTLGPTVGTTLPQVGEPCHPGGSGPNYIARAGCRHCLNDALECVGERWTCISPSIEACIPIPPPDAGPDAWTDAATDASETAVITDASSDAPRDTSAEASTDVATDVNRDVPNDAPRDASSDTSADAATDAGDAGTLRLGSACTNGQGVCARDGVVVLVNGQLACNSYPPGLPSPEICNHLDDDCDGQPDNHGVCSTCSPWRQYPCYGGTQATQGVGICRVGYHTCDSTGSALGPCMNQVLPNPRGEICANGYDDDCDGATDEAPCVTLVP